jgi:hypothetical protein
MNLHPSNPSSRLCLLTALVLAWLPVVGPAAPAPKDRGNPEAEWLTRHKGAKKTTAVTIRVEPGTNVARVSGGLRLPVTITNGSARDINLTLPHEWHGGEWPTTDLYASVTPARTAKSNPFHEVFRLGERPGESSSKVTVPPGKSVKVELRLDWPGTGSVPAVPLMDPASSGSYRVRLLLVVEGDGKRYAVSGPMRVELPAK